MSRPYPTILEQRTDPVHTPLILSVKTKGEQRQTKEGDIRIGALRFIPEPEFVETLLAAWRLGVP
jgi:hypothetical protein